jgi:type II secretory pathway pseudopilin PulG
MKKAQVMTMETIAVLLVFFIIFAFVLIFYMGFQSGQTELKRAELSEQQAVQMAQIVANMPELECTGGGIETGVDCFDIYKIEAMSAVLKENEDLRLGIYQERFGSSEIKFKDIYNLGHNTGRNWTVYSKKPENFRNQYSFQTLVSLNDPAVTPPLGIRTVGLLEVIYFS